MPGAEPSGLGLSPRVRGNLLLHGQDVVGERSIPACAGEPSTQRSRESTAAVYPRVCGGTSDMPPRPRRSPGLSPRVRGNPLPAICRLSSAGSIPACAGEPITSPSSSHMNTVYPRVCGGTSPPGAARPYPWGLSPRVRGNHRLGRNGTAGCGSIPACAGEPLSRTATAQSGWVYPRVCGGTDVEMACRYRKSGLSPRVRGNPIFCPVLPIDDRSIPACAGEPTSSRDTASGTPVYPRVCGGTMRAARSSLLSLGLSPRVRGEPAAGGRVQREEQVYPRVCGGTRARASPESVARGLSPRVRGNHGDDVRGGAA